jgi:hypothetical protein
MGKRPAGIQEGSPVREKTTMAQITQDGYWCIVCQRMLVPEEYEGGNVYVHDDIPHPEMDFAEEEKPQ